MTGQLYSGTRSVFAEDAALAVPIMEEIVLPIIASSNAAESKSAMAPLFCSDPVQPEERKLMQADAQVVIKALRRVLQPRKSHKKASCVTGVSVNLEPEISSAFCYSKNRIYSSCRKSDTQCIHRNASIVILCKAAC